MSREVPTHLFKFEDKLFGLTVPQLLIDATGAAGLWSIWGAPLPIYARIPLCMLGIVAIVLFVHARFHGRSVLEWTTLGTLFWLTPPKTIWYTTAVPKAMTAQGQQPKHPSVQATWIRLAAIENGFMGFVSSSAQKEKDPQPTRYSVVIEVIGINLQLLSSKEQFRIFEAYERFLAGLEFPLQIISRNETIDISTYEPLLAAEKNMELLSSKPRLATMAQYNIQFLRRKLGTSIVTRHFVVVSANSFEEALRGPGGKNRSSLTLLFKLLWQKKKADVSKEMLFQQLRLRLKVVNEGFKDMGLQTRRLDNDALAQFYATCLVPGASSTRGEHLANALTSMLITPAQQSASSDENVSAAEDE